MSPKKESYTIPAIVAIIGIIAFLLILYLLLYGSVSLLDRLLGGDSGIPALFV